MSGFHEDDDMKIVGERIRPHLDDEDPAEAEARLFLRHREAGNIEKARELGRRYAHAILESGERPAGSQSEMESHQQLLLCSFLVNRVIGENSPDSILAQTSLHVFYDEVAAGSTSMSKHVSDLAAFSLYTLWERSRDKDESELGRIYAKLCEKGGSRKVIKDGNALSKRFYKLCLEMMEDMDYIPVEK